MKKPTLRQAVSVFWIVQFVGWGLYGIARFAESFLFQGTSFGPNKLLFLVIGFGLTTGLFFFYEWNRRRTRSLLELAGAAFASSALAGAVWFLCCEWLIVGSNSAAAGAAPAMDWRMQLGIYINLTQVFLSWSLLYFGVVFWLEMREQREIAQAASAASRQAELKMLRYQLNPHFLFNSLNSIRGLVDEDPVRAKRMVTELSEFLRSTLLAEGAQETTLEEEIDIVRSYLEIEKIRFEEKLKYQIHVDDSLRDRPIPRLLIYPLIENALKYGKATSPPPLEVELIAHRGRDALVLEVRNTGALADTTRLSNSGTGTGLENIRKRLQALRPGRHGLSIQESNGWVRAQLTIPIGEPLDA